MQAVIAGLIRHLITTIGGSLIASGTLSDSDLQALIGAVLTIFGIVWSVIQKRQKMPPTIPVLAFCLLIPTLVSAQSTNTLAWDLPVPLAEAQTYTQAVLVDDIVQVGTPTCVAKPGSNGKETECSQVIPALQSGPRTITIQVSKTGITAETRMTGFNIDNGPKNPNNIKIKITVNVTVS